MIPAPRVHREVLTSERAGNFGFTMTTTVGESSWSSDWVHVPLAKSHDDVAEYARAIVTMLEALDEGDSRLHIDDEGD